jgi:hypothetical protein
VRPHEDSWLVARADELVDRHIVTGELGCPICFARYPVRDGVVDFSEGTSHPSAGATHPEMAVRAAALLGLTEPGGIVVLAGEWTDAAGEILELTENIQLLALDYSRELRSGGALSLVLIADTLPLAAASVRGIALDAAHATPSLLAGAARALAPEGRLIAPAHALVPASLRELARDDAHWVAVASTAPTVSAPVSIGVKRHAPV